MTLEAGHYYSSLNNGCSKHQLTRDSPLKFDLTLANYSNYVCDVCHFLLGRMLVTAGGRGSFRMASLDSSLKHMLK